MFDRWCNELFGKSYKLVSEYFLAINNIHTYVYNSQN